MKLIICKNNEILFKLFNPSHNYLKLYEHDVCNTFIQELLNSLFNNINTYFDYDYNGSFQYWNGGPGSKLENTCGGIIKYNDPPENFNDEIIYNCIFESIEKTDNIFRNLIDLNENL